MSLRLIKTVLMLGALFSQNAPYMIRVDVPLVSVDVTVLDTNGRPATQLRRQDFLVFEDGQPREIKNFASTETPYNILSLMDCTGSTREVWPFLTQALSALLNTLRMQDRLAVALFGRRADLRLDWTSPNSGQVVYIPLQGSSDICSTTDFYGALEWSVDKLRGVPGRQGVIVFSDGFHNELPLRDVTVAGATVKRVLDPDDDRKFQALLRTIRSSGITFYFIAVSTDLNPGTINELLVPSVGYTPLSVYNLQQVRSRMELLTAASGGRIVFPKKPADVIPLYQQIGQDLGRSYSIGFTPSAASDGRYHKIEIRTGKPGMQVRQSRDGYASAQ